MRSDDIKELAAALVKAQGEFGAVPKNSLNPFFKSKYAALPDVVSHATPILAKHGLAVSQFIDGEYLGGEGLTTYLLHESGQFIAHTMPLHLPKSDPQSQGSAVTYARRYAYMAALGLVADEDDDGNSASKPAAGTPQRAPRTPSEAPSGDVGDILRAAELEPSNAFLESLAEQYGKRGSLSEKQIASGLKIAKGILAKHPAQLLAETFDTTEEEPF